MVTFEALTELKEILKSDFDMDLSQEEVAKIATDLMCLFEFLTNQKHI